MRNSFFVQTKHRHFGSIRIFVLFFFRFLLCFFMANGTRIERIFKTSGTLLFIWLCNAKNDHSRNFSNFVKSTRKKVFFRIRCPWIVNHPLRKKNQKISPLKLLLDLNEKKKRHFHFYLRIFDIFHRFSSFFALRWRIKSGAQRVESVLNSPREEKKWNKCLI